MSACHGHFPACTHVEGAASCWACVKWRRERGLIFCDDLDNCGGPGCMDHLAPVVDIPCPHDPTGTSPYACACEDG